MSKLWDWIKSHPWETGLGVFGIGALFVLFNSGGSSTTTSSTDPTTAAEVADAAQLQAAQLQANVQTQAIGAQQETTDTQTAAAVSVAGLQAATQQNSDTLSAQTSQVIAALQAQVADVSTQAAVEENANNDSALVSVALAPYQAEEDAQQSALNEAYSIDSQVAGLLNSSLATGWGGPTGTAAVQAINLINSNIPYPGNATPGVGSPV